MKVSALGVQVNGAMEAHLQRSAKHQASSNSGVTIDCRYGLQGEEVNGMEDTWSNADTPLVDHRAKFQGSTEAPSVSTSSKQGRTVCGSPGKGHLQALKHDRLEVEDLGVQVNGAQGAGCDDDALELAKDRLDGQAGIQATQLHGRRMVRGWSYTQPMRRCQD